MILSAQNVVKTYAMQNAVHARVLRGASLTVEKGEFLAIVGPSGAGKSTLLHALASIDRFDSGIIEARVGDKVFTYGSMTDTELAGFRSACVGFVYQFHQLLPEFTAIENVLMPALIAGKSSKQAMPRALALLERVGLAHRSLHMPSELSGGEQQRVAIARAIMNAPAILFADEPTGNLDSENATIIRNLLRELQQEEQLTCIVATHSDSIMSSATRLVRMADGVCQI